MNIFLLEDDFDRLRMMQGVLRKVFPEKCSICCVQEVNTAEMLLELGTPEGTPWDLICLDHDLGGKTFVDYEDPNTGYQVAKFIREKNIPYKKCIIHSMNYAGAMKMRSVLKEPVAILPIVLWTSENLKYVMNS